MTARTTSMISKTAFAASLLVGAGLLSATAAFAQSNVIVNYGAIDDLDDAAPAAQTVDPATYARGNGYPFATGPDGRLPSAYGPNNPYAVQQGSGPAAVPAPMVESTQTYGSAPEQYPDGYNKVVILGSPKMDEERRRSGQLPYSMGTKQYRAELAQQVASGTKTHPLPTASSMAQAESDYDTSYNSSFSYGDNRSSGYAGAYTPTDDLPRRVAAAQRPGAEKAPDAYHRSDDGLIRRVSSQSGTMGVTKAMLQEAAQRPDGLPPVLVIKFNTKDEDLNPADRSNLSPVVQKLEGKYQTFEVVGFASDSDSRVAKKRSLDRVVAVRNFLIENGVSSSRIKIRARGAEASRSGKLTDQVVIGGAN